MTRPTPSRPSTPIRPRPVLAPFVLVAVLVWLTCAPAWGRDASISQNGHRARSAYPALTTYPVGPSAKAVGRSARAVGRRSAHLLGRSAHPAGRSAKASKPSSRGNPARALLAFQAMQKNFYIQGTGLYRGEPYSFLWPFSQAFAATVSLANIPGQSAHFQHELHVRLYGLQRYLGSPREYVAFGASTGASLRSYNGTVAPPVGPGGASYYDDNEWVGIELVRTYELSHNTAALEEAEQIMAFVMAGWQNDPELACPGGLPFSNAETNTDRNTVTDGPAAELGAQLYRITHEVRYLNFAEMAYEWVRQCLLQPSGLYADHIERSGEIEPTVWSYNQGTMMGAGTLLYQLTGNAAYLYEARQTARAAVTYFTPARLAIENPFFVSVYFRNLLYLDSVTHDPPGAKAAQAYVNEAWQSFRLGNDLFFTGSPPVTQLLTQAAVVQIYALLSTSPSTYF
jgi:Glycosyl hydrolase family 76